MIRALVIDVDGILTDGTFLYDYQGEKSHKVFGADDNDALKLLAGKVEIVFVSADSRGFLISESRVRDMGHAIYCVSSSDRLDWIKDRYDLATTCYIGDGFYDSRILTSCGYSISTASSSIASQLSSSYITPSVGGQRALSEAVLHLCIKFFPDIYAHYCSQCRLTDDQTSLLSCRLNKLNISDLAREYIARINERNPASVLEMLSDECVVIETGKSYKSPSDIQSLYAGLCAAESLNVSIYRLVTAGLCAIMHLQISSEMGDVEVVDILDFNPEGYIKSIRAFF